MLRGQERIHLSSYGILNVFTTGTRTVTGHTQVYISARSRSTHRDPEMAIFDGRPRRREKTSEKTTYLMIKL